MVISVEQSKSDIIGKTAIITLRPDGFRKAGTVVNVDSFFIYLRFERSGTIQAIPISQIEKLKIEELPRSRWENGK
jgi:hypothetical protein